MHENKKVAKRTTGGHFSQAATSIKHEKSRRRRMAPSEFSADVDKKYRKRVPNSEYNRQIYEGNADYYQPQKDCFTG